MTPEERAATLQDRIGDVLYGRILKFMPTATRTAVRDASMVALIEEHIRDAIAEERDAYTRALQIHATDLQQACDAMKGLVPDRVWARVQGATSGIAAAIRARASQG